jgi:hypothetical protein
LTNEASAGTMFHVWVSRMFEWQAVANKAQFQTDSDLFAGPQVEKVQQAHALWSDGANSASRSEWDAEDAQLQVVSPRRRGGYGEAVQVSDRGVESQNSSLVKLLTLGQQLQIECEPVWECMARMPHATRICEGSEVEIIVLWNR